MGIYDKITPNIFAGDDDCNKVILFDPSPVYERITITPTSRRQSLSMGECFPNPEKGYCACGCGNLIPKRSTRWFEPNHAEMLVYVMKVIQGDSDLIRRLMRCYLPLRCATCGREDYEVVKYKISPNGHQYINYSASGIHVDHIVSVKNGGGGCWLGNYQFLCHSCNIQKERTDRLVRNIQPSMPTSSLFNY